MKERIEYYYKIVIDKVYYEKTPYFYYNDYKYYIYSLKDYKEFKSIINVIDLLKRNNLICNEVIKTSDNKDFFSYNSKDYYVMRTNMFEEYEITLNDILKYNINEKVKDVYFEHVKMLEDDIDTFETYVTDNTIRLSKYETYITFFIGVSENCVAYINDYEYLKNENHLSICHKIIDNNNIGELQNINNVCYGIRVYDIGCYFRNKIFLKEEYINELDDLLKMIKFNDYEYICLFSFIIFPIKYMNLIKNEEIKKEIDIRKICYEYLKNVKKIYYIISKYYILPTISWLLN